MEQHRRNWIHDVQSSPVTWTHLNQVFNLYYGNNPESIHAQMNELNLSLVEMGLDGAEGKSINLLNPKPGHPNAKSKPVMASMGCNLPS